MKTTYCAHRTLADPGELDSVVSVPTGYRRSDPNVQQFFGEVSKWPSGVIGLQYESQRL